MEQREIKAFQSKILSWYAKHQRDLPWRRTREPYHILVSEIMLQQTQVSRVIPKYDAWMKAFPTLESLAKAKTSDVLRLWSGLGYNRRAIYLQKAARVIVSDYKGSSPKTVSELKKLPGVGEYTARAVACFAFDEQIAVVDTNIRRVILTQFQISNVKYQMSNEKEIQKIAEQLLPKGRAYEWNQALMDYAGAVLKQERIPLKKQSTFKGSNRYYRGQTVKLLLEYQAVSIKNLAEKLGKDEVFISSIIAGLVKDGLVIQKKDKISLS